MNYLYIALISMVPLIELRGAIPVSQGLGLPIIPSYIVCILIGEYRSVLRQPNTIFVH